MAVPAAIAKGDLASTPFPRLLWKIAQLKLTGKLECKKGEVAKTIYFQAGHPVHAESNLLHETLGKMLVEEKGITAEQEQAALVKALEGQKPFPEVLIELKILDAARLTEALQRSFALKILDCFRWEKGTFLFSEESDFLEKIIALKMNPARLVLKGIETIYPMARIEAEEFTAPGTAFKVPASSTVDSEIFQLSAEQVRFLKAMKDPRKLPEVAREMKLSPEETARKAYGFSVLGLLEPVVEGKEISLDELVGATLIQSLRPVEPPKPVSQIDEANLALANEIASEQMRLTSVNYYELLGVPETASAVEIRDKFVDFAARYNPARFRTPELGDFRMQGEEIFLRGVKAFATLSDFDSKTKYLDKIKAERQKAQESGRKKPGEAFKITTKLLDGDTQFQKGMRFLKEKNFAKAIEFFEYAIDIDTGKPSYVAHLGWATYSLHPERNVKSAEEILRRAREMKPEDEMAAFYLGKFLQATLRQGEAVGELKRAAELAPKNPDIVREARNAERLKK